MHIRNTGEIPPRRLLPQRLRRARAPGRRAKSILKRRSAKCPTLRRPRPVPLPAAATCAVSNAATWIPPSESVCRSGHKYRVSPRDSYWSPHISFAPADGPAVAHITLWTGTLLAAARHEASRRGSPTSSRSLRPPDRRRSRRRRPSGTDSPWPSPAAASPRAAAVPASHIFACYRCAGPVVRSEVPLASHAESAAAGQGASNKLWRICIATESFTGPAQRGRAGGYATAGAATERPETEVYARRRPATCGSEGEAQLDLEADRRVLSW